MLDFLEEMPESLLETDLDLMTGEENWCLSVGVLDPMLVSDICFLLTL